MGTRCGSPRPTPLGGRLTYRYDPEWVDVASSYLATDRVYVEFEGRTAYGDDSRFPFFARSADWQEGDRLLAGVITAFGSPTGVIKVGGWGEFQGTMTESFRDPRIEGSFDGVYLVGDLGAAADRLADRCLAGLAYL